MVDWFPANPYSYNSQTVCPSNEPLGNPVAESLQPWSLVAVPADGPTISIQDHEPSGANLNMRMVPLIDWALINCSHTIQGRVE